MWANWFKMRKGPLTEWFFYRDFTELISNRKTDNGMLWNTHSNDSNMNEECVRTNRLKLFLKSQNSFFVTSLPTFNYEFKFISSMFELWNRIWILFYSILWLSKLVCQNVWILMCTSFTSRMEIRLKLFRQYTLRFRNSPSRIFSFRWESKLI